MPIITQGLQNNQITGKNPKELDRFQLVIQWTYPDYLQTTSWIANGLPQGLNIDNTGSISGKIEAFLKQPLTMGSRNPIERFREDMQNWDKNGQSSITEFIFNVSVIHNFIYNQQTPSGPVPTPMVENGTFMIKVLKNYSIDNKAIVEKYYSDGWKIQGYNSAVEYINNSGCSQGTFPNI